MDITLAGPTRPSKTQERKREGKNDPSMEALRMWMVATHAAAGRCPPSKNEDQLSHASLTHLNPFHALRACGIIRVYAER